MLFQSGALFDSMNVFDNVAFPLREHAEPRGGGDRGAWCAQKLDMVRLRRTSSGRCPPTSRAA